MKIAPIDIRQQRFSVKFRGFDPQEVDTFLEMVADELEDAVRENDRLKEHLKKLEMQVEELSANEASVKKTLLAAQTLGEDMAANARKEAELIVRDARSQANDIIGATRDAASGAREELAALLRRKKQLILNMRSMMETHLRMLETEELSDDPVHKDIEDGRSDERRRDASPKPPRAKIRAVEVPEPAPAPPLDADQTAARSKSEAPFSVFIRSEQQQADR